jgi:hypothetical protein
MKKSKILSPEEVQKIIAANNEIFKKASKAEKRIMIAKDIIQNIKEKKYIATTGSWVGSKELVNLQEKYEDADEENKHKHDLSLQELLISNKLNGCQCCALGSIFLETTRRNNKEKISDLCVNAFELDSAIECGTLKNGMDKIFSRQQLEMIEYTFEQSNGSFLIDDEDIANKCMCFAEKFDSDKDLLIGIMENIVKNKGTFKP